jgi:alpha-beta hydrolase superfamily lysophospholipase
MRMTGEVPHEQRFTDSYGVEVFTRWWPIDAPTGVVVIAHGASEHSGRYDRFARALNAAGFAAVAIDHRGQGHTAVSTGVGVTGPGGGQAIIDDMHALRSQAAATFGDVPMFVFGHSLGSLLSLAYLVQHSDGLAGGVLCGFPASVTDVSQVVELLRGIAEAGMRDQPADALLSANNAPFEPARTPSDWLSRDEAEVDAYIADPMSGDGNPLTFGYFIDVFDVVAPVREQLDAIRCPVLVIAGDQDPAAAMGEHPTTLASALEAAGREVRLILYPGARHEILNETNRDEVTADVVSWLSALR